jgi:hypothetical protein
MKKIFILFSLCLYSSLQGNCMQEGTIHGWWNDYKETIRTRSSNLETQAQKVINLNGQNQQLAADIQKKLDIILTAVIGK